MDPVQNPEWTNPELDKIPNGKTQKWSRGHKARGQGHKKNLRPILRQRTALPRTDPIEAKDRITRD